MTQGPWPPRVLLRNYRQNYFMWLRQRETQPGPFMPTAPLLPERQGWALPWPLSDTSFQGCANGGMVPSGQGSSEHRLWLSSQSRSWAHQRRVRRRGSIPPPASAGPSLSIPICRDSQIGVSGPLACQVQAGIPTCLHRAALPQTPWQSSLSFAEAQLCLSHLPPWLTPSSPWIPVGPEIPEFTSAPPFLSPPSSDPAGLPLPSILLLLPPFVPFLPQALFQDTPPRSCWLQAADFSPPSRWCVFLNTSWWQLPAPHCRLLGVYSKVINS